jgi:hypothetical protein
MYGGLRYWWYEGAPEDAFRRPRTEETPTTHGRDDERPSRFERSTRVSPRFAVGRLIHGRASAGAPTSSVTIDS